MIVFIIYSRTFYSIGADYSAGIIDATFLTRLNALSSEITSFIENPLIGKGLFFYDADWKEQQFGVLAGILGDEEYVAYNHIGYTSVLAQSGIVGFFLLLLLPFLAWKKFIPKSLEDKIISQTFILYLIIFLISGSPIRTDFPDQFFYYFVIGYMVASNKKN